MPVTDTDDYGVPGYFTWSEGRFYLRTAEATRWTPLDECPMYAAMAMSIELDVAVDARKRGVPVPDVSEGWYLSQHLRNLGWKVASYGQVF